MRRAFTINNPHVVHETIDGETILIHLGTGTYYSLDGLAGEIWGLLTAGSSDGAAIEHIEARYDADARIVAESVTSLVEELLQEGLLVQAPDAPVSDERPSQSASARAVFAAPVLHKYTDMQEFMLVDPIHDVDAEAGWPHVKAG
jgi:Coenzyme PQQ synthesis protein D (PqqD)